MREDDEDPHERDDAHENTTKPTTDGGNNNHMTVHHHPNPNRRHRPRLTAMREQLQTESSSISQRQEQGQQPVSTIQQFAQQTTRTTKSNGNNHYHDDTLQKSSPPLRRYQTTNSLKEEEQEQMRALRQWVDTLPDLPPPSCEKGTTSSVLTDRFHRQHTYLRLSLTERCNLRCTYCMPHDGVPLHPPSHLLQTSELLQLAQFFAQHGVTKFRLTGGEPTLRKDLVDIVQGLSSLLCGDVLKQQQQQQQQIGMTTNGIVLASKLPALVNAGLCSVNVSLDTLNADKFARLTRRPEAYLAKVWEALEACQDLLSSSSSSSSRQFTSFKLNCVVMRHVNTNEIADFVRLTMQFPNLCVRFIEYMPFTQNGWNRNKLVPYQELLQTLRQDHGMDLIPMALDDPSDTTKWYKTPWAHEKESNSTLTTTTTTTNASGGGGGGRIGFITSMSHHFCGTCNRLRLTADGQLKVCLFDGITELSLRDAIRAGFTHDELSKVIHAAIQKKHYKFGGHMDPNEIAADVDSNRPMTLIGG